MRGRHRRGLETARQGEKVVLRGPAMERARASPGGENMQSEGSDTPREGERQRMQPREYGKK